MSVNFNAEYTKNGATFADANAAVANKDSLFSAELKQAIEDCYATMLADGVLLEPVSYVWDQSTYMLTVVKLVSSVEAYRSAITFNALEAITNADEAGWTYIPNPA